MSFALAMVHDHRNEKEIRLFANVEVKSVKDQLDDEGQELVIVWQFPIPRFPVKGPKAKTFEALEKLTPFSLPEGEGSSFICALESLVESAYNLGFGHGLGCTVQEIIWPKIQC